MRFPSRKASGSPGYRISCFICNNPYVENAIILTTNVENILKRDVTIERQHHFGKPHTDINVETCICNNCNIIIVSEVELLENTYRLTLLLRINKFIMKNIYIPNKYML